MKKLFTIKNVSIALTFTLLAMFFLWNNKFLPKLIVTDPVPDSYVVTETTVTEKPSTNLDTSIVTKTVVLAGGCFWSVERDLEKVPGVISVIVGYAGGTTDNPTYENHVKGGHREVVEVTYDANRVTYENLVESVTKHSDPTDARGSFYDRGFEYAPVVYYETRDEKRAAEEVLAKIEGMKIYPKPIVTLVVPRSKFWPAEEYHQDYAKKNPIQYNAYREASGRSAFIKKYWGGNEDIFFTKGAAMNTKPETKKVNWESYTKPADVELQKILTPLQYKVTQEDGTEPPYSNEYDTNKAEGIYVDIVSGEPLFSSKDKFDSGTGWPSFVKPITPEAVVYVEENVLFLPRTEVRSKYADSHLGHVFDDGPSERGGKRYCMNGAALRFIPKEDMGKEGYGKYVGFLL